MKKGIIYTTIVIGSLVSTACTKEIEVDLEQQEPRVVVMSCVEPDADVALKLSYSRFFLSTEPFQTIDDARVTLTVNGGTEMEATCLGEGQYNIGYRPQAGDRLSLAVGVPGQRNVTATTIVPPPPVVANVSEDKNNSEFKVRFTLVDPAEEDNYYMVRVVSEYHSNSGSTNRYYCDFHCQDYLLVDNTDLGRIIDSEGDELDEWYGRTLAFSDENINGTSHELTLNVTDVARNALYYLELTSCTRDRYLFEVTSDLYDDDPFLNLFAEPVQIHTNIDGGIGIFAARNRMVIPLFIEPHNE